MADITTVPPTDTPAAPAAAAPAEPVAPATPAPSAPSAPIAPEATAPVTPAAGLKINAAKCQKCGTCASMYPDLFEVGPDGSMQVKQGADFTGKNLDEIKAVCGEGAIE